MKEFNSIEKDLRDETTLSPLWKYFDSGEYREALHRLALRPSLIFSIDPMNWIANIQAACETAQQQSESDGVAKFVEYLEALELQTNVKVFAAECVQRLIRANSAQTE